MSSIDNDSEKSEKEFHVWFIMRDVGKLPEYLLNNCKVIVWEPFKGGSQNLKYLFEKQVKC